MGKSVSWLPNLESNETPQQKKKWHVTPVPILAATNDRTKALFTLQSGISVQDSVIFDREISTACNVVLQVKVTNPTDPM